jgi:hypothetical protein
MLIYTSIIVCFVFGKESHTVAQAGSVLSSSGAAECSSWGCLERLAGVFLVNVKRLSGRGLPEVLPSRLGTSKPIISHGTQSSTVASNLSRHTLHGCCSLISCKHLLHLSVQRQSILLPVDLADPASVLISTRAELCQYEDTAGSLYSCSC